jgi:hypothetical protein
MPYRADLETEVNGLEYSFTTGVGRLYVPPGAGPDMDGAVKLFTMIDPKARKISVLAGLEWATVGDHWEARRIEPRSRRLK